MKQFALISVLLTSLLLSGCGNNPTQGTLAKPSNPSIALIQKKMGIILPSDSLVISLVDNSRSFMFTIITGMTDQQAKSYFNSELTAKGYTSLPAQPNDLAGGLMKYSILKDLVNIRINPVSGKSNISFERRFKQL